MSPEAKAAQSLIESMTGAFHAGDIDGVMSAYEPGAVVVFNPDSPESDAAAIRAAFSEFFALGPNFTYAGHEVIVAGDIAVHIAPWEMTGALPDGTPITDKGLSVAVLRKQPDGHWLMVLDHPYGDHLLAR